MVVVARGALINGFRLKARLAKKSHYDDDDASQVLHLADHADLLSTVLRTDFAKGQSRRLLKKGTQHLKLAVCCKARKKGEMGQVSAATAKISKSLLR